LVFTLAKKTGWSIDYIMWQVPLKLMTQARHTFLWAEGVNCRSKGSFNQEEMKSIEKFLDL